MHTIRLMPKTYNEIPREQPTSPVLDRANTPEQLRHLSEAELPALADELPAELVLSEVNFPLALERINDF